MRTISLLFAGLAVVCAQESKPDFTGTWVLKVEKSHFGSMPKPLGMKLVATRNGESVHAVETTESEQGGPTNTEGDWFLDGQQHPAGKMTQMSKWEGNTLYAEKKSADGSYREVIRMTLSPDGKTATEKISVKSPNGQNTSTLVWEKQEGGGAANGRE